MSICFEVCSTCVQSDPPAHPFVRVSDDDPPGAAFASLHECMEQADRLVDCMPIEGGRQLWAKKLAPDEVAPAG